MNEHGVAIAEIDRLYERLVREAEVAGYQLNPDVEFTKGLIKSLMITNGDTAIGPARAVSLRERSRMIWTLSVRVITEILI